MVEYKYVNKKIIGGKSKRIYKKQGSNKQYLKNKGKMIRVTEYRKKISGKKIGGAPLHKGIDYLDSIKIDTFKGLKRDRLIMSNAKKSLHITLHDTDGNNMTNDNFCGLIEVIRWEEQPDGKYHYDIVLVVFEKNNAVNKKLFEESYNMQKIYQKFDKYEDDDNHNKPRGLEYDDGSIVKYAVCTMRDVNKPPDVSSKFTNDIASLDFNNDIKKKLLERLKSLGVTKYKAIIIKHINFKLNCKGVDRIKKEALQQHRDTSRMLPIFPKMATPTKNHLNKPFLKVMVPSVWYSVEDQDLSIVNHNSIIYNILKFLLLESRTKFENLEKNRSFNKNQYILMIASGLTASISLGMGLGFGTVGLVLLIRNRAIGNYRKEIGKIYDISKSKQIDLNTFYANMSTDNNSLALKSQQPQYQQQQPPQYQQQRQLQSQHPGQPPQYQQQRQLQSQHPGRPPQFNRPLPYGGKLKKKDKTKKKQKK